MFGTGAFDPVRFATVIVTLIIAITVHEFMHAWTAWRLGDDTARLLGRISLNPAVHFDPVGAFMFILVALGAPALAWGRPVPVNMMNLRPLGRFGRHGSMAVVALAGPLSNVVLGAAAATSLRLASATGGDLTTLGPVLLTFMTINFGLAAFNMIPVPPLDGSRLLNALLPDFWRPYLAKWDQVGFMVLFALIIVGGGGILWAIAGPVYDVLLRTFLPGA